MDDYTREAIEIVKAQAKVRVMSEEEIMGMVQTLSSKLRQLAGEEAVETALEEAAPAVDPRTSIRENSIICLVCGNQFKVLTQRHLDSHGLTAETYREKFGFKKNTPLICRKLQRERRNKMKEMKLWERRETKAPRD